MKAKRALTIEADAIKSVLVSLRDEMRSLTRAVNRLADLAEAITIPQSGAEAGHLRTKEVR